jgi:hypothetical protein
MADIRVRLICSWCDNEHLRELWNRMTPNGDYRWNDLVLLAPDDRGEEDYFAVINCPKPTDAVVPSKSIVLSMEARRHFEPPAPWRAQGRNNVEWHLSRTYRQLMNASPDKSRLISSVMSGRTHYPGHRLRHRFLWYLDAQIPDFELYGRDPLPLRSYRGPLPYYAKDAGLLPYQYTFAAENTCESDYFTEKVVDAVLAECLCFYWGCPNLEDYIDPRAYIRVPLENPIEAIARIHRAIADREWEQRIDVIRREKRKILNELQFFPTLERIISARDRV